MVATGLNNLGDIYFLQGRYSETETLYKRSRAIREKALGPGHPYTASSVNNLAVLYQAQGRHVEAEPLYKLALAISEKALGPDHPDVANTLSNLADLYRLHLRLPSDQVANCLLVECPAVRIDQPFSSAARYMRLALG